MAIYSITDLEKLTGIKAHTIRIWEQRYGVILPKRTPTNIRYYDEDDLRQLLNIALLNKNGIKISIISKMTEEEITNKVSAISEVNFENTTQLDALTISMIEMDEYKFEKIISSNIEQYGFEKTMRTIIHPFLEKLGLLWLTGSINPAQEHFISYLIRRKVIAAIDRQPIVVSHEVPKFLLFLPEGESQELSLLFLHYLLIARGIKVVYLGQSIPIDDLEAVYKIHQPDYIFTIITEAFYKYPVQTYVEELCRRFTKSTILATGYQVISHDFELPDNGIVISDLDHTIQFINSIKKKQNA